MGGNRRARGKRSMGHRPKRPIRCIRQVPKPVAVKMRTERTHSKTLQLKAEMGKRTKWVFLPWGHSFLEVGGGECSLPRREPM